MDGKRTELITEKMTKIVEKMVDLETIKIYGVSFGAFTISLTNIDLLLKITLLVVSIGYTATKWWKLMQDDRTSDEDKKDKK